MFNNYGAARIKEWLHPEMARKGDYSVDGYRLLLEYPPEIKGGTENVQHKLDILSLPTLSSSLPSKNY